MASIVPTGTAITPSNLGCAVSEEHQRMIDQRAYKHRLLPFYHNKKGVPLRIHSGQRPNGKQLRKERAMARRKAKREAEANLLDAALIINLGDGRCGTLVSQ